MHFSDQSGLLALISFQLSRGVSGHRQLLLLARLINRHDVVFDE